MRTLSRQGGVFSWFLAKVIFRYTTTYFIRDTPRVSQYSTPSYERSCPPSRLLFEIGIENSKKFKTIQNYVRPSRGVIIHVLVSTKNTKLGIWQLDSKGVHRNELSSMKILGFRSKWRVLWPRPCIVCWNVPILYTYMHLGSTDNVDEESFPFYWTKKPFSIFRVWKMVFFAKHRPQICCKNWEIHYLKTPYHVICTNN